MGDCQLVTGGAGFIGSNFVRSLLSSSPTRIVIVDSLTYAGNLSTLQDVLPDPRVEFVRADIADSRRMREIFQIHSPMTVVNFAAETHVDRSIDGPRKFLLSNTVGVFELLECIRHFFTHLSSEGKRRFRFLQVSTDEVFGTLPSEGAFVEDSPYAPRSPYSATKASADHLVRAYQETYGIPTLITNCSNNYGPYQFPEKLVPLVALNALAGQELPVYGRGENIRDWLHVDDHCEAISAVLDRGPIGSTYNIGARNELSNLAVVHHICQVLEELSPASENPQLLHGKIGAYQDLITFVADRPGHDFRYAINPSKIELDLGWRAKRPFRESLKDTLRWYLENPAWCAEVKQGAYSGERLGLDSATQQGD